MGSSKKAVEAEGRGRSKPDSRSALIDAALDIILERGIDALRLEDVIEAVGVTKGAVYWHFEDREDLIRSALSEHIHRMIDATVDGVSTALEIAKSPEDYLFLISPFLSDPFDPGQVEQRWQKLELLATARRDPVLAAIMQELQIKSLKSFADVMKRAKDKGVLRSDMDPVAVAVAVSALGLGSNLISYLGDAAPTPEAWRDLMAFFIATLFPDPDQK